jgi:MFS family permease
MSTTALDVGGGRSASSSTYVVGLLGVAILLSYVDRGLLAVSGPLLKDELGLNATEFGLAVSAFFWIYAPGQLVCGWLVDRFDVKRLFGGGVALWGVATALMGAVGGLFSLVMLRAVLGFSQSFCFTGSSKIIAHHCRAETRGAANGVVMCGIGFGQMVGAGAGGMIMAMLGWRAMCVFFGLLTLAWLIPWPRVRINQRHTAADPKVVPVPLVAILHRRALWGSAAAHFCNNYGLYFVITWLPIYLVGERGMSIVWMATVTAAIYGIQALSSLLGGWLSDRLVANGRHEGDVRKAAQVLANIIKASAIVASAMVWSEAAMIFWLAVAAAMMGVSNSQNFAVAQLFAGARAAGRWVGIQNFGGNCAGILGPVITGLIVDASDSYTFAFVVAGAITLGGALFWGLVVPRMEPIGWDEQPTHAV